MKKYRPQLNIAIQFSGDIPLFKSRLWRLAHLCMVIIKSLAQIRMLMMTREEIQLVKKSWRIFQQINPALVGDVFYSNLFAAQPRLRKMFPQDMQLQYQKLVDMLSFMVRKLNQPELVVGEIQALAERHIAYGVKANQYEPVGKALLLTLKQGLGNDWTPPLEAAWTKCYQMIAGIMMAVKPVNS